MSDLRDELERLWDATAFIEDMSFRQEVYLRLVGTQGPVPSGGLPPPAGAAPPSDGSTAVLPPEVAALDLGIERLRAVFDTDPDGSIPCDAVLVIQDLPDDGRAGRQRQVGLLIGIRSALSRRGFVVPKAEFEAICKALSVEVDQNIQRNLVKNSSWFADLSEEAGPGWRLTSTGRKAAAELVKRIARAEAGS